MQVTESRCYILRGKAKETQDAIEKKHFTNSYRLVVEPVAQKAEVTRSFPKGWGKILMFLEWSN